MPIYIWFEGVPGPVKRKGKSWIVIDSAQPGVTRTPAPSAGQGDRTPPSELTVTKALDVASTALFRASRNGTPGRVVIEFVNEDRNGAEESPYLTLELHGVVITAISTSVAGGVTTETVTLNYGSLTYSTKAPGKPADRPQRVNRAEWYLEGARS